MAKTILQTKCPFCGKLAHEKLRYTLGAELWIDLECGHTLIKDALASQDCGIVSKDGRKPFDFQMTATGKFEINGVEYDDSVHFLEAADCNGLCLHEQGLGKTVIECILLKRNPQLLPALLVVKSGLRAQWFAEILRWTGMVAQVITSSREQPLLDIFDIVIVSIDTLRLLRPDVNPKNQLEALVSDPFAKVLGRESDGSALKVKGRGKKPTSVEPIWSDDTCAKFKHVAVDESQKIKNEGSTRTKALRKIVSLANDGKKARVICYSGTNIEKHAGEFFVTLNLTRPELFPQQAAFQLQDCNVDAETGKIAGLKNPARFKEKTKDFIIRYKRELVLPQLPKVFRQFRLADMEGDELKAYIKIVREFMNANEDPAVNLSQADILGYLSRMRHITGIAKVNAALEFIEEFLLESERKLVVFRHHKTADAILTAKLAKLCTEAHMNQPLHLYGGMKMGEGSLVIEEFKKPGNRILLASEMASGEGYNMQFCSDCLFMERQWNPSIEEQCEGRFPRPRPDDPWPVGFKINAHYLIAAGTIDDFLTDIIETKRANVANTLDGETIMWDEKSLQSQLSKVLLEKGLMKWGLK